MVSVVPRQVAHLPEDGRPIPPLPGVARRLFRDAATDFEAAAREGWDQRPEPVTHVWAPGDGCVYVAELDVVDERPWLVRGALELGAESHLVELRQIVIEPWLHDGEVSTALLRKFKPAAIRDRGMARLRSHEATRQEIRGIDWWWQGEDFDLREQLVSTDGRKRGRPALPASHYEDVAEAYLDLYERGVPNVLVTLATRYGKPRETVRDWVRRTRELGYLSGGSPGKAGAVAGPALLDARRARDTMTKRRGEA